MTDASDPEHEAQDAAVESLLDELGLASTARLHVWNKVDQLTAGERRKLMGGGDSVLVSAQSGEGLDNLRKKVASILDVDPMVEADFDLPSSDGKGFALLHQAGKVLSHSLSRGSCPGEGDCARIGPRDAEVLRLCTPVRALNRCEFNGKIACGNLCGNSHHFWCKCTFPETLDFRGSSGK